MVFHRYTIEQYTTSWLYRYSISPLYHTAIHHFTAIPLHHRAIHHFTVMPLQYFTASRLCRYSISPLHGYAATVFHRFTVMPLQYFIASRLCRYSISPLHHTAMHHFTAVRLWFWNLWEIQFFFVSWICYKFKYPNISTGTDLTHYFESMMCMTIAEWEAGEMKEN